MKICLPGSGKNSIFTHFDSISHTDLNLIPYVHVLFVCYLFGNINFHQSQQKCLLCALDSVEIWVYSDNSIDEPLDRWFSIFCGHKKKSVKSYQKSYTHACVTRLKVSQINNK